MDAPTGSEQNVFAAFETFSAEMRTPPGRKQEERDLEHSERTRLGYFLPKEHEQMTPTGPSHTSIVSTMNPTEIGTNAENVSE